jgi:hypothetical protein
MKSALLSESIEFSKESMFPTASESGDSKTTWLFRTLTLARLFMSARHMTARQTFSQALHNSFDNQFFALESRCTKTNNASFTCPELQEEPD